MFQKSVFFAVCLLTIFVTGCGKKDPLAELASVDTSDEILQKNSQVAVTETKKDISTEDAILNLQDAASIGADAYKIYTKEDLEKALASEKTVILYFHSEKSATCKAFKQDLTKNVDRIPASVVLFEVDRDVATEEKETYAVPVANTFVYLLKDGKEDFRIGRGILQLNEVLARVRK